MNIPQESETPGREPADPLRSHFEEMRLAHRVVARLLPRRGPRPEGLEWAGLCLPHSGVGGDFYDFLEPGPGRLVLALGDVSGKGVAAALMMATLQASLRSHFALGPGDLPPLLESVNRLFTACTASEHYATLFLGELDQASGRLGYVNCGHVSPILLHRGLRAERLGPTATPLGMFEAWTAPVAATLIEDGDLLLIVSDGVTEAVGPGGDAYGDDRLLAALLAHRELRPSAVVRAIADEVREFAGGRLTDDLTLVAARARACGGPGRSSAPGGNAREGGR
jgi:serine phosphatase RsbU (regulator of sigma subunit)